MNRAVDITAFTFLTRQASQGTNLSAKAFVYMVMCNCYSVPAVYSQLSPVITQLFFPSTNPVVKQLAFWAVFAMGFVSRWDASLGSSTTSNDMHYNNDLMQDGPYTLPIHRMRLLAINYSSFSSSSNSTNSSSRKQLHSLVMWQFHSLAS